jgi:hypothetical protein
LQSHTKKSMMGTSVSTPTTVANAAPEVRPKSYRNSDGNFKVVAGGNNRGRRALFPTNKCVRKL